MSTEIKTLYSNICFFDLTRKLSHKHVISVRKYTNFPKKSIPNHKKIALKREREKSIIPIFAV